MEIWKSHTFTTTPRSPAFIMLVIISAALIDTEWDAAKIRIIKGASSDSMTTARNCTRLAHKVTYKWYDDHKQLDFTISHLYPYATISPLKNALCKHTALYISQSVSERDPALYYINITVSLNRDPALYFIYFIYIISQNVSEERPCSVLYIYHKVSLNRDPALYYNIYHKMSLNRDPALHYISQSVSEQRLCSVLYISHSASEQRPCSVLYVSQSVWTETLLWHFLSPQHNLSQCQHALPLTRWWQNCAVIVPFKLGYWYMICKYIYIWVLLQCWS